MTPLDVETAVDQTSKLIKRLNAHLENIAAALKPTPFQCVLTQQSFSFTDLTQSVLWSKLR